MLIYKNHYALIKNLYVFSGNHNCNYICRSCLNSNKSQNASNNHMEKYGEQEITSIKLSNESFLYWKKQFHKNPLYFRNIAIFEADDEVDNSPIENKTTHIYKQSPVVNGY